MKKLILLAFMVLGIVSLSFSQTAGRTWNKKDSSYVRQGHLVRSCPATETSPPAGERFDYHKFTAAHKFLPLGSYVRVTNLSNGRTLIVKINDRMPLTSSPIIDFTRASAEESGLP